MIPHKFGDRVTYTTYRGYKRRAVIISVHGPFEDEPEYGVRYGVCVQEPREGTYRIPGRTMEHDELIEGWEDVPVRGPGDGPQSQGPAEGRGGASVPQ